ncbi:MAG: hypothetical protein PHG14_14645 [Desulfobacter postgatei]|jgi:hypothetical protein|uniref:hypothetical protein n=1 Tax=Desulfobacter postgatei TaxID=2293 RepID=UPI0023F15B0F|nr:hypothetical protein [Desulfobacter postgatei]MDD4274952.1 hypothetical protein [Desulfobacter postgatei]MDX9962371.1 hypothetical protein [Desulfobacter postgatei]
MAEKRKANQPEKSLLILILTKPVPFIKQYIMDVPSEQDFMGYFAHCKRPAYREEVWYYKRCSCSG